MLRVALVCEHRRMNRVALEVPEPKTLLNHLPGLKRITART